MNTIKKLITPNKLTSLAAVLNILGLFVVLLSIIHLSPLTLIFSLGLGAPLIFLSLFIFLGVVIAEERKRKIT